MSNQLVKAYQQVREQKKWMLAQVAKSNVDKNSHNPNEKWSINQLIFHLYNVESSILEYINYKHSKGELTQPIGMKAILKFQFLKALLKTKLKFKTPKRVSEIPEDLDFNQLITDWENTQIDFELLLSNFPKELHNKGVFRHPYAGFLSIKQTIAFMVDHSNHHKSQMNRLSR